MNEIKTIDPSINISFSEGVLDRRDATENKVEDGIKQMLFDKSLEARIPRAFSKYEDVIRRLT